MIRKNKTPYCEDLTIDEVLFFSERLVNKYLGKPKKITNTTDRMKAVALKKLIEKENKTLEEMKLEADLSYYLDQKDLCFTDL